MFTILPLDTVILFGIYFKEIISDMDKTLFIEMVITADFLNVKK